MANFKIVLLLLFDIGCIAFGEIVNADLPDVIRDCKDKSLQAFNKCIMDKFNNGTRWIKLKGPEMNLTLQQDFYWHSTKRVRAECRTLSEAQRQELWDAVNALKNDKSEEPNVYDWIADFHTNRAVYSVHYGPNFFGWHRVYILRFEELLRKKNPNVTLCYWDSRIDDQMSRPPLTVMFSPRFFGNPWGNVKTGPFAGWKTIRNVPLRRDLGAKGSFMSYTGTDKIMAQENHFAISEPTAEEGFILENMHNNIHSCLGGQMNNFNTSSQEPAFWFHHAFVDSVWEKFCAKMKKKGVHPQDDYVTQWITNMQKPEKYMDRLTPLRNIDGYSHYFTKNIYQYEDWPSCDNNCGNSGYLSCDKDTGYCFSKEKFDPNLKPNNFPKKYQNHLSQPLSDYKIIFGEKGISKWVFVPIKIIFRNSIQRDLIDKPIVGCSEDINSERCSKAVAVVHSKGLSYNGTYTDYINCDVTIPLWTYAFVAVKNPKLGTSQSFVSITTKDGQYCQPVCLEDNEMEYEICSGIVDATLAEPLLFTNTVEEAIKEGYKFDPLSPEKIDKRIKLKFLCH